MNNPILKAFLKRFPPTSWPFLIGIALLLLGLSLSVLILTLAGAFIIGLYVVIWVIWLIIQTK